MAITIQNKLEILKGNKIVVPGCEPTSAFTSVTLESNRQCTTSVVDLKDALEAIPGSTVVSWGNPLTRFFVLPSGPPPSPDNCGICAPTQDWYAMLRSIAVPTEASSALPSRCGPYLDVDKICSALPIRGVF